MNVMMLLEMASGAMADRTAVECGDDRWTHADLYAGAGRLAERVRASAAEHIAVLDESSPAVPLALFASGWAGKPFVPLNYRLTGSELDALIERITPAVLVTDAERAATLSGRDGLEVLTRDEFLSHARGDAAPPDPDWSMEPEEIAILLFTSGTTGTPKAAVLRHRHMVSYILGSVEFMAAAEEDGALVSVPPYHVAGMAAVLSSIYAGRRIVQLPAFSPEGWLEAAERSGVTNAFVVPTMLQRIVAEIEDK